MKYADKYPSMLPIFDEVDGIMRTRIIRACRVCNRITEYVEINYGVPLCSDECLEVLERMIEEDLQSRPPFPFEDADDEALDLF